MKNSIKISVITATYNSENTLIDCMQSFASQDYNNKEHIVIDGASTDSTTKILYEHIENIAVFISERDGGIYDALNKGISHSSGDVIGFLHSDDLFSSTDILTAIAASFKDEKVIAVYGDLNYVNKDNLCKIIRKWKSNSFYKLSLFFGWMPPHPTLFVRREWYTKIGGFDKRFEISADYDSVLKFFFDPNFKSVYLPRVFVTMRLGGKSNRSFKFIFRKTIEDFSILKNHGFCFMFSIFILINKNLRKIIQFL